MTSASPSTYSWLPSEPAAGQTASQNNTPAKMAKLGFSNIGLYCPILHQLAPACNRRRRRRRLGVAHWGSGEILDRLEINLTRRDFKWVRLGGSRLAEPLAEFFRSSVEESIQARA